MRLNYGSSTSARPENHILSPAPILGRVTVAKHVRPKDVRALIVLVALFCVALGSAQTGRMFVTVDALVAGSDAVYAGSIKTLEHGARDTIGRIQCHVVVLIDETLKGPPKTELTLDFKTSLPAAFLESLSVPDVKFLWVPNHQMNGYHPVSNNLMEKMGVWGEGNLPQYLWFRLYPRDVQRFSDFDTNVFTADLRVIGTWDDLLKEARSDAKRYPKQRVGFDYYDPSRSVAQMCGDPNAYAAVIVPLAPETETLARRLIEHPEKVVADALRKSRHIEQKPTLGESELLSLRRGGIRLLANFPSERNRKLLESLKGDLKLHDAVEQALKKFGGE